MTITHCCMTRYIYTFVQYDYSIATNAAFRACAFCVGPKRNNDILHFSVLKGFKTRDFKICHPEKKLFWDELKR
jgi:hypothetical protein